MPGFRGSPQELVARFGLSARLRVRVGALYGQRVDLSEAVLEMAGPGSPLESMLLQPGLLEQAAALDDAALLRLAEGQSGLPPLAVIPADGWRTIALLEEREALAGFASVTEGGSASPAAGPLATVPASVPLPFDQALELPTGELEKARWTLLTSVEPAAKVEAVRVLQYAPLPLEALGQLLARALGDEFAEVRGEAARAFARLGVDPEIAETSRRLLSGDEPEQVLAVDRLVGVFDETPAQHRPLVVVVLTRALGGTPAPLVRDRLLDALREVWPRAGGSPEGIAELLRVLLPKVARDLEVIAPKARALLLTLAQSGDGALVARSLMQEAGRTGTASLRRFLLAVAGELDGPEAQRTEVARRLAAEIDRGVDLDPIYVRMETSLAHLGPVALDALVARLDAERSTEVRVLLINLLDQICREAGERIPSTDKNRVLEAFVRTYQVAPQRVREGLLGAKLYGDPALAREPAARMAAALLETVQSWKLDRVLGDLTASICALGEPALDPVLEVLRDGRDEVQRERTGRILGELASRLPVGDATQVAAARRALAFCAEATADPDRADKGELFAAWGRIASRPDLEAAEVTGVIEALRQRIWGSSYTYKVIEGLGAAGSSSVIEEGARKDVAQVFLRLLDGQLPRAQGQMRRVREDEVFYLGPETTVYTEMIPGLLDGLERIHRAAGESLRRLILVTLLSKWDQIADFKLIWSPRTVTALGELLGRIGAAENTPAAQRLEIARGLRKKMDNFQVLEGLAGLANTAPGSPELDALLGEVADEALSMAGAADYQDDEDQRVLLRVLVRLLYRPQLGLDPADSDARKKRLLAALFEGARRQTPTLLTALKELDAAAVLPAPLARDLAERLPRWLS